LDFWRFEIWILFDIRHLLAAPGYRRVRSFGSAAKGLCTRGFVRPDEDFPVRDRERGVHRFAGNGVHSGQIFSGKTQPRYGGSMTTLTEQDSGRTVEVNVGRVVEVRLTENPTTGYRWTVEAASGVDCRFDAVGGIGAVGMRVFQFRSNCAGLYELRLKNWREWEGESSVLRRFEAKILVK
jgi:inhibitor of cysteine peptidase